jgi:type I restriction enzyme S subunit
VENVNEYYDRSSTDRERYVAGDHIDEGSLPVRRWGLTSDDVFPPTFNRRFRAGDVLFHSRNLRKLARPAFDGITGEKLFVLRVSRPDLLLPSLLPYVLQSADFGDYVNRMWAGSTNKFLNKTPLMQYEFALPPLERQRSIASLLQEFENSVESLVGVSASLDTMRRSAFERVLSPEANGWETASLGCLFEITSGGTPSRARPEYWGGTIPWVKTAEVNYEWITDTEECITPAGLAGSSAKLVPVGSIVMALFGQGPTLGRVARLSIEAATNQACAVLLPNDAQDQGFFFHFLWRQYPRIRAMARGANQPNLNLGLVKSLQVPVLPIDDQRRISRMAEAIVGGLSLAQERLEALRQLHSGVLHAALAEG